MTDRYKIDLTELSNAIEAMKKFDARAEAIVADVNRRVAALHLESWSGAAAAAQQHYHDRWTADAQEMRDGIGKLHDSSERAHRNYSGAQANNVGMWELG